MEKLLKQKKWYLSQQKNFNMKKIFILFIFLLMLSTSITFAQNDENKDSETAKKINSIDQIKDKVASRVAELKLVEKRGIVGIVESIKGNQIRITDLNNNTRTIDVDELTKFSSSENSSFDLSDIAKGSKISAIGLYNKESERLLARFVNEISIPEFISGVLSNKNEDDYTINLVTEGGKKYILDIEKTTKSYFLAGEELQTAGFSKFQSSQNATIIGFIDPKDENKISVSKIIIFPDLPKNPKISIENESHSKTDTPTSPSPTP
jgi:hypothetical protein